MSTHIENMSREELLELVRDLSQDVNFGCWTRPGLELIAWPKIRETARWIICADLDQLHQANAKYGEDEVNRRFRQVMRFRAADAAAIGRWQYGDELVIVLSDVEGRPPTDPRCVAQRLQDVLNEVELSATFGIARVTSYDLAENVKPAWREMARAKRRGRRGTINQTGALRWRPA